MPETEGQKRAPDIRRLLAFCVGISLAISLFAAYFTARSLHYSLYQVANLVGSTAQSLLEGRGLEVRMSIGSLSDPLLFRSSRMPMASIVVAALAALLGPSHLVLASLVKATLFLVPIWAAMGLVLRQAPESVRKRVAALLLVPFGITAFLADVTNLPVEEGYAYSLLAYAFALIVFPDGMEEVERPYARAILLGLSLAGLFLTKSSLIVVAAVLVLAYLVQQRRWGPRAVVIALVFGTVAGWGIHQKSVSGRFSPGTSLDGINLHKGNTARFAERYPPRPGENLDGYDVELNAGHAFRDEWAFDDYHKAEGIRFIQENPGTALRNDASKAFQYFVSLSKSGSSESRGGQLVLETLGLLLFRIGFWTATVLAIRAIMQKKGLGRFNGWTFIGVSMFAALPYLLGFAYTRHASVLIYPAALLLCRAIIPAAPRSGQTSEA